MMCTHIEEKNIPLVFLNSPNPFRAILSKYSSPTYLRCRLRSSWSIFTSLSLSLNDLLSNKPSLSLSQFPTKSNLQPHFPLWVRPTLPQNLASPTPQHSHLNLTPTFCSWIHNQVPFANHCSTANAS